MQDNNIIQEAIDCLKRLHKENAELKAENEKLKALCDTYRTCYQVKHSDIKCLFIKYKQTLQEIKDIAMGIMDDDIEESSAYSDAKQIIDLITKAESEE